MKIIFSFMQKKLYWYHRKDLKMLYWEHKISLKLKPLQTYFSKRVVKICSANATAIFTPLVNPP